MTSRTSRLCSWFLFHNLKSYSLHRIGMYLGKARMLSQHIDRCCCNSVCSHKPTSDNQGLSCIVWGTLFQKPGRCRFPLSYLDENDSKMYAPDNPAYLNSLSLSCKLLGKQFQGQHTSIYWGDRIGVFHKRRSDTQHRYYTSLDNCCWNDLALFLVQAQWLSCPLPDSARSCPHHLLEALRLVVLETFPWVALETFRLVVLEAFPCVVLARQLLHSLRLLQHIGMLTNFPQLCTFECLLHYWCMNSPGFGLDCIQFVHRFDHIA